MVYTSNILVIADKISLRAIFRALNTVEKKIVVLDDCINIYDLLILKFAKKLDIKCELKNFYAGDLKLRDGTNLYLHAVRITSELALNEAISMSTKGFGLEDIAGLKMRCIALSFAKKIQSEMFDWVLKAEIVRLMIGEQKADYIQNNPYPKYFFIGAIENHYKNIKFIPSNTFNTSLVLLLAYWLSIFKDEVLSFIKLIFNKKNRRSLELLIQKINSNKSTSILVFQENTNVRKDLSLRAQPYYWHHFDKNNKAEKILVETKSFGIPIEDSDKKYMISNGISIISKINFFFDIKKNNFNFNKHKNIIKELRKIQKLCIKKILTSHIRKECYYYLQSYILIKNAIALIPPLTCLNVKTFVYREPQFRYTDAIDLISKAMNIDTVCYQYSNLGLPSPVMTCNAKYMLLFSDHYRKIFQTSLATPENFRSIGYLYTPIKDYVSDSSRKLRDTFKKNGVNFIISYYDESVQFNKYGLVSPEAHLKELTSLVQFALDRGDVGIIIKSQYLRNSPSVLYPDNHLILKLSSLGRYIELHKGHHRNEVYPMEAALSADLCIGHKFGATAILEAAAVGARGVLLDKYKFSSPADHLYSTCKILYSSIDEVIEEIKGLYTCDFNKTDIGCWKKIINNFSYNNDNLAPFRMSEIINL